MSSEEKIDPSHSSILETSEIVEKKWYLIHATSGFEHSIVKAINRWAELKKMNHFIGEVIVPVEKIIEMRAGKKRKSERKFFPGYVLIHAVMTDEVWYMIRSIPKVLGFIGGNAGRPVAISEQEVNKILHRIEEGLEKPKPKVLFEVGEVLRIIDGPFSDFSAVVESVDYEKSRLQVAVLIFGRSTPVELEFSQVSKS